MNASRLSAAPGADATTNMDLLRGLRIAITGGTSGLGHALVAALVRHGAHVAFIARNREALQRTQARFPAAHAIAADVARKEEIHPAVLQITGLLGGLDVLVNNASSLGPVPLALLGDTQCEAFEQALDTNVLGPFRLTRALLGALAASAREGRGAVVVNISSDAAQEPYPGWGAYGASKAALLHMTRIWDEEAREHGIRFLSIDPGDMDTPLHALAVPDADRSKLKAPADAAGASVQAIAAALPAPQVARGHRHASPTFGLRGDADAAWGPAGEPRCDLHRCACGPLHRRQRRDCRGSSPRATPGSAAPMRTCSSCMPMARSGTRGGPRGTRIWRLGTWSSPTTRRRCLQACSRVMCRPIAPWRSVLRATRRDPPAVHCVLPP